LEGDAALLYAEATTGSGHAVEESEYEQLASHRDDREILEIALVIGLFEYFNRVNDALRVEVRR
jgi:alkylhydroperoxidase family enzyme